MAIDRTQKFFWRDGGEHVADPSTTYLWVGGAPLKMTAGADEKAMVTSNMTQAQFYGVALLRKGEQLGSGLGTASGVPVTVLKGPGSIRLVKETLDAYAPWAANITFAVGDLLRPVANALTGGTYSQWTNAAFTSEQLNCMYVYPAMVRKIDGSGANPTALEIDLGWFTKIA